MWGRCGGRVVWTRFGVGMLLFWGGRGCCLCPGRARGLLGCVAEEEVVVVVWSFRGYHYGLVWVLCRLGVDPVLQGDA